jgi:hypothetical protein
MLVSIQCTIIPALMILIVYYDWEFADVAGTSRLSSSSSSPDAKEYNYQYNNTYDTTVIENITEDIEFNNNKYLGYAMQFQLLELMFLIWDCLIIPMGFTAFLPWYSILMTILGYQRSVYWMVEDEGIIKLFGKCFGCCICGECGKFAIGSLCVFMMSCTALGSLLDVVDFEKEGFFSYHGGSQFMGLIVFISYFVLFIINMLISFDLKRISIFLKENVKPNKLLQINNTNNKQNEELDDEAGQKGDTQGKNTDDIQTQRYNMETINDSEKDGNEAKQTTVEVNE